MPLYQSSHALVNLVFAHQSVRSERHHTDSLSIVITSNDPMIQYYTNNPSVVFAQNPPGLHLPIDLALLKYHSRCAGKE
ncbi:hypothetical protein CLU79DRAFT_8306 [Phycomyces nitens]|nr:hypothetical protein CLU79DRAFT_8306 [Phycomyces nitens]